MMQGIGIIQNRWMVVVPGAIRSTSNSVKDGRLPGFG